jgi:hypothetical protein
MASRTQLRLQQLTGSAVDLKTEVAHYATPIAAASLTGSDLQDILGAMGAAIQRIHGKSGNEFLQQTAGTFDAVIFDVNTAGAFTVDAGAASEIATSVGALTLDGKAGVSIQENNATIIAVSDDRDITTTNTRQIHLDASGVVNLNSSAGVISIGNDAVAQNINVGTGAAARTITIGNTTGATKLDIDLGTGGLDVDVTNGPIALDTTNTGTGITIGTVTSGVPISIGHTTSEVTVNDNLTVTGDLTVSGDTVTVNTTNLNVEDSIIGLGFSGSNPSPNGDRGILFGKAAISNPVPGLWYDAGNSDFNFATSITDAASSSFGTTSAYQALNAGNLGVYGTSTLRGTIEVGSGGTANDLILSSAAGNDLRLDSNSGKVFVDQASGEKGSFGSDAGAFYVSSSAGNSLTLDSNLGLILLAQDTAGGGGNGASLVLGDKTVAIEQTSYDPAVGTTAFKFTHNDAYATQFMEISGSMRILEPNQGGQYVELKTAALGGNVSLTLPGTDGGAADDIMVTDGSGVLSFKSTSTLGISGAPTKAIRIVTGSGFAPGATIDLGGGLVRAQSSGINNLSLADSQGSTLDVFVNGQILLSGSEAQVTSNPPTADFMIDTTGSISFCFALEADDVIQVIKR